MIGRILFCRLLPCLIPGLVFLAGCSDPVSPSAPAGPDGAAPPTEVPHTLLALGDSYTVGHSLPQAWSWPFQLADSLAVSGDSLATLDVVAETGWTTRDLLTAFRDFLARTADSPRAFSAVTVMVGVNDQNRGVTQDVFAADLDTLLALATELAGGTPDRVLAFTIPNYGLTPVGNLYGTARVTAEIATFNRTLADRVRLAGISLVDITTLSELVVAEPALVSRDGLHYSREMYRRWTELMLPLIRLRLDLASSRHDPGPVANAAAVPVAGISSLGARQSPGRLPVWPAKLILTRL